MFFNNDYYANLFHQICFLLFKFNFINHLINTLLKAIIFSKFSLFHDALILIIALNLLMKLFLFDNLPFILNF